ncbi:hypothetical protein AUK40_00415 [Candidatus Wirthbacteria bacterium CG2_30_54_11]|uniref:Uncharacterized protein n=1 Tax=Candidatus Wirthbacteria bacterium CG2_30_54_11 TaxID=1817892 RepID=A0A1J5ISV6_9BACT|nr:MAG: hypothetical protein AUK40_00415 [Candidatus Wirthbacteria bacterium CG2_30_54_11]
MIKEQIIWSRRYEDTILSYQHRSWKYTDLPMRPPQARTCIAGIVNKNGITHINNRTRYQQVYPTTSVERAITGDQTVLTVKMTTLD